MAISPPFKRTEEVTRKGSLKAKRRERVPKVVETLFVERGKVHQIEDPSR